MTPQQVRKAFDKSPKTKVEIQRLTRPKKTEKPTKATRLTSQFKKPKLLLDVPMASSSPVVLYKVPNWFVYPEKPEVSIIIPMFRSGLAIKNLIDSWDLHNDGIKVEIIFVDDNCPHNSKSVVLQKWAETKNGIPAGKIIYSPENQGFGISCNIGASYASGDYLIFLNADTTVTPGWLRPIVRLLKKEEVGIVGNMQLKKSGGKDIVDSAGSEWNWNASCFQHIGRDIYNGTPLPKPFLLDNCPKDLFEAQEREMVTGACLAIRKKLFDDIGGFNPNYRLAYWEDSEICMVVKELGYKVMYQPNSRIYHVGSHSNSGGHRFHDHNVAFFMNKWVASGRIDPLLNSKRSSNIDVNNIVVRRQGAHGDALIAAAVVPALKKKHPNCKVSFSTMCPEVVDGNPFIDKIVDDQNLSERSFHVYYNLDMAYEYRPNTNILKAYAEAVGVKAEDCALFLKTTPVPDLPESYIVFHAGKTNWVGRDWASSKFDILASQLQKMGHKVICVGTTRDNRTACDLDLRGKTNISELAHVIKNCKLFVGIDSFPMHVAQTFDVPGVCFFGSINPDTRIVSNKIRPVVATGLKCLGCHHRQPAPCVVTSECETQFLDCINQVSVQQMMSNIKDVLGLI